MVKPLASWFYPKNCEKHMELLKMSSLPGLSFMFYHASSITLVSRPKEDTSAYLQGFNIYLKMQFGGISPMT